MKIILALLLTISVLCGGTLDFRSGKVLCAEISSQAPSRLRKLANPIFELPETPVYAALTALFDEGRSISLHDYAIHIFGNTFRCIAIQRNNSFISVAESPARTPKIWQTVEPVIPKTRYTLYFALDSSAVIGTDSRETLELKALFHPGSQGDRIPFENLGSRAFTPQSKIPLSGKIVTAAENKVAPQPPKPAAKETAAKADGKVSAPQNKAPAAKKTAAKAESKVSKPQSKAPAAKKSAVKKSSKGSKSQKKASVAKKKAEKK